MQFYQIVFVVFGIIYLIKPDIFRRGIWTQTSIMQRNLSPAIYNLVMRVLGVLMIVTGLWSLIFRR